jgi:dihydropteroate synthase
MIASPGKRSHPGGLPDRLLVDRCLVMGVLNVTPDSFSDGGLWPSVDTAVAHGLRLVSSGADLVDVGGESTRPGAERVSTQLELDRVIPVVAELAAAGVCVSVDTMRSRVAQAALEAGALMVNDVSGGRADPDMLPMMAERVGPYVVMHWRAHSAQMNEQAVYGDVVDEVASELLERVAAAQAAGISADRLVVDPGLGFAKESEHNWALVRRIDSLVAGGLPVLIGASRKRFLGALLADGAGPRPVAERDAATHAVSALAAAAGVWCVRVHEVEPTADAVRVVQAWQG